MTTSTKERKARSARKRATWICDNCHGRSAGLRKRCVECGTSRY
jgi:hypothetical protein